MSTPTDFEDSTCLIGNWLISIMGFLSSVDSLCLDPINKNSVLVVFSVSLFAASHIRILSKSMLKQRSISSTSLLAEVLLIVNPCSPLLPLIYLSSPLFPLVPPCYPCYPLLPLVTPYYHLFPLVTLIPLVTLVTLVTPCYHLFPLVTLVPPCSPC